MKPNYSKPLQDAIDVILFGLGLPVPNTQIREPWGYRRDGDYFLPNNEELEVFATALDMSDSGDYHKDDIVAWFQTALPDVANSRRTFFYLKAERPLFPEWKLPLEERIKIANGLTSPTPEETSQAEKS